MIDQSELEEKSGIRFTYDKIPYKEDIMLDTKVPLTMINTPFKLLSTEIFNYQYCVCPCKAILNPYCTINFSYYTWNCNFCGYKNKFPTAYKLFLQEKILPEACKEENFCVEYIKDINKKYNLYFIIAIDKCVEKSELEEMKKGIINLIPEMANNLKILFFTFDRFIQLYTNRSSHFTAFNQFSPYLLPIEFLTQLKYYNFDDYVFDLGKIEDKKNLIKIIQGIDNSKFDIRQGERFKTSTGKVFDYILELKMFYKLDTLRSLFIIGGPCTISEGKFIDIKIKNHPRQRTDLEKNNETGKLSNNSKKFFDGLATKAVLNGVTFDIIGFCLDEYGFYELSSLVEKTGGIVFFNEEFSKDQYHKGLIQYFSKSKWDLLSKFCFNGELSIICSNNLKINGSLGACNKLEASKIELVSKDKLFESGTNRWLVGCCDYSNTICTFFTIEDKENKNTQLEDNENVYFQSFFKYIHPDGTSRIRVATFNKKVFKTENIKEYGNLIDQISLITTYIKMAADRSKILDSDSLLRWLDKNLLIILKRFSNNGNIMKNLQIIPQFFFYLRKSSICRQIAISLDEVSFFRTLILREETSNCLIMIQPVLYEYSPDNEDCEGNQILCEITALKNEVVLLMDNFINIVIWKGETIMNWEKEGYFELEEYKYLNNLNIKPQEDLEKCIEERLFYPEIFNSYKDAPNERILKTKLNPDLNKITENNYEESLITDEKSFSEFLNKILSIIREKDL